MFRQVMVPLDGSAFAEAALPLARALAARDGAILELVTVHEPVPTFAQADWESSAREWSEHYLNEVTRRLGDLSSSTLRSAVLSGPVAEELEEHAEEGADVLVMATHGRGALTRAWLGSVADHFVRHSPCPVLLIRPTEGTSVSLGESPEIYRIVVPLDGSDFSETVLEHAAGFAHLFDASLVVAQVVAYPIEIASPYLPHTVQMNQRVVDDAKASSVAYLERVASKLREDDIEVEIAVEVDTQPGHGILRIVEDSRADMVAMATHARRGVSRAFLGSTADKVVRGTHHPVFLHRPPTT